MSMFHGKGIYTYPKSSQSLTYRGEFVNQQKVGDGEMRYRDGSKYLGRWNDNLFDGPGTFTYADGTKWTGTWVKNMRHGQGIETNA